jgi:tetratricopeptide (TPR) repeat protein
MLRGAALTGFGRFNEAQQDLETAHTAYSAARVGERETLQVNLRLVNLQLAREDWQQAEWLAETTLRRLDRVGTSADRSECTLLLAEAQFGMGRPDAALNNLGQVLVNTHDHDYLIRARAYLMKARVDLKYGGFREASEDCDSAHELFLKIGTQRGLRACEALKKQIENA